MLQEKTVNQKKTDEQDARIYQPRNNIYSPALCAIQKIHVS